MIRRKIFVTSFGLLCGLLLAGPATSLTMVLDVSVVTIGDRLDGSGIAKSSHRVTIQNPDTVHLVWAFRIIGTLYHNGASVKQCWGNAIINNQLILSCNNGVLSPTCPPVSGIWSATTWGSIDPPPTLCCSTTGIVASGDLPLECCL